MRYSKDPAVDRTLRHSVRDGVAYSAMSGGGETYFSAFALFLKASAPQVALLATLPPLLGSLAQLLSAWLVQRLRRRKPLIMFGAGMQALTWLPLMALPLLFPERAVPLLIACVTLYHAMGNFAAPPWIGLMGDLVPERKRGRYFGRRTRLATMTAFLALVAGGLVLHLFARWEWTLLGFLGIFTGAALARVVSVYHLGRMHEPVQQAAFRGRASGGCGILTPGASRCSSSPCRVPSRWRRRSSPSTCCATCSSPICSSWPTPERLCWCSSSP